MKRLFVRPELCTGCKTCEIACAVEHSRSKSLLGAMMESPPPHSRVYVEAVPRDSFDVLKFPMTCRHCDPAPCIAACIPRAMHSCCMCIMMCPFGMIGRGRAPNGKIMALKCDLCPDREVPACAAACPTGAITYVEGDEFAHQSRVRASTVLAEAKVVREVTLVQAQEE